MGYSVKLEHVTKETSFADLEEHGYICLKNSAGDESRDEHKARGS